MITKGHLANKVENILANLEIACCEQFLVLPQCLQMLSVTDASAAWKGLGDFENMQSKT